MLVYFSSSYPAAVKLDGAYLGRCDLQAKRINLDGEVFAEICPLNGSPSAGFLIDEKFFCAPPSFVTVADLKGAYLVRAFKTIESQDFKVIAQKKFPDAVVTVFTEGSLKATVETPAGVLSDTFPFFADSAEISRTGNAVTVFFKQNKSLHVYDVKAAPKNIGCVLCDEYNTDGTLTTVLKKKDIAKHVVKTAWNISESTLSVAERTVTCSDKFDREKLSEKIIPYAFAEELCVGGDYSFYLSEDIKPNAAALKGYLGNFIAVMPPPPFRDFNEVGLIYKKYANVYYVDYLTAQIANGKIDNIKRSEN